MPTNTQLLTDYHRVSTERDGLRAENDARRIAQAEAKANMAALVDLLTDRLGADVAAGSGAGALRHRVQCALDKLKADRDAYERHVREIERQQGIGSGFLVWEIQRGKRDAEAVIRDALAGITPAPEFARDDGRSKAACEGREAHIPIPPGVRISFVGGSGSHSAFAHDPAPEPSETG